MKLFLDDIRDPIIKNGWLICRSFDEAVATVLGNGFPEYISFDHDLGEGKSGFDFAKWLVDYDLDTGMMPEKFSFYVHSSNPVGKANIEGLLRPYIVSKQANTL